jgi:hypothetical protein
MIMKPSVGRIVLLKIDPSINNGADVCPGIITRVWGPDMVNVREFRDEHTTGWRTSVKLFETEEEARAYEGAACFWPPRV